MNSGLLESNPAHTSRTMRCVHGANYTNHTFNENTLRLIIVTLVMFCIRYWFCSITDSGDARGMRVVRPHRASRFLGGALKILAREPWRYTLVCFVQIQNKFDRMKRDLNDSYYFNCVTYLNQVMHWGGSLCSFQEASKYWRYRSGRDLELSILNGKYR